MVPNEPKLSIVIPVLGTVDELERTLISVLQCRDATSEVILVLNRPYDDPYALGDEVRFIHAPPSSGWVDCVNLAIDECRAPIVHLLACGATVEENWTDDPLAHFNDPIVGSVTPLVVEPEATDIVRCAGVAYDTGGRRRVVARGENVVAIETLARQAIGPTFVAGFYRRELLLAGHGFSSRVGDLLADVDFALRLQRSGFATVLEPAAGVRFADNSVHIAGPWQSGRNAERLFRRHITQNGWLGSLARHAMIVASELWPLLPLRTAVPRIMGRAFEWLTVEPLATEIAPAPYTHDETISLPLDRGPGTNERRDSLYRRSA